MWRVQELIIHKDTNKYAARFDTIAMSTARPVLLTRKGISNI